MNTHETLYCREYKSGCGSGICFETPSKDFIKYIRSDAEDSKDVIYVYEVKDQVSKEGIFTSNLYFRSSRNHVPDNAVKYVRS